MATFDGNHLKNSSKYRVLAPDSQIGLSDVQGVFGMGSCTYQSKLYYFFGGLGYSKTQQVRNCTNQIIEFDPDTRQFEPI